MRPLWLAVCLVLTLTPVSAQRGAAKPKPGGGGTPAVSLAPSAWSILYSYGMPAHPAGFTGGIAGWWFDFPATGLCGSNPCSVNYLLTNYAADIRNAGAVTMTVQTIAVSGAPVFDYQLRPDNTCTFPAHARIVFTDKNFNRWWSNPIAYQLDHLAVETMTTDLTDPTQWSGVNGQFASSSSTALADWTNVKAHVTQIGMTFGGGCFFGHGVSVSNGAARFALTNFQVVF